MLGTWSCNFYAPNDVEKHIEIISVSEQKDRKQCDSESLNDVTSMRRCLCGLRKGEVTIPSGDRFCSSKIIILN